MDDIYIIRGQVYILEAGTSNAEYEILRDTIFLFAPLSSKIMHLLFYFIQNKG